MKCFSHRSHEAVGICKCCGKAVCSQCVIELENQHAIVCSSGCARQMASTEIPAARSSGSVQEQPVFIRRMNYPYLFMGFGGLLLGNGLFNFYLMKAEYSLSTFVIGILIFILTVIGVNFRFVRDYFKSI